MTCEIFIDVREPEEFAIEHIPNAINIPLSQIGSQTAYLCQKFAGKKVIFLCQSGSRAKKALAIWNQHAQEHATVLEGGLSQWKLSTQMGVVCNNTLPIFQQVQLTIGILLIVMSALSYFVSIYFLIPIVFFGCGLTISGLTGFCGLAKLLLKMPWNRIKK